MVASNVTLLTITVVRRQKRLSKPIVPCEFRAIVMTVGPTMTVRPDLQHMRISLEWRITEILSKTNRYIDYPDI